jgi:hypothetical protein
MPINHRKRWTISELIRIKTVAKTLPNKQAMYSNASTIAKQFGRTEAAVCKKIEDIKGWYWAA